MKDSPMATAWCRVECSTTKAPSSSIWRCRPCLSMIVGAMMTPVGHHLSHGSGQQHIIGVGSSDQAWKRRNVINVVICHPPSLIRNNKG